MKRDEQYLRKGVKRILLLSNRGKNAMEIDMLPLLARYGIVHACIKIPLEKVH